MYSVKLQWKEFSVDLPTMEAFVKALAADCAGNSAGEDLTFWFTQNDPEAIPMHDVTHQRTIPGSAAVAATGSAMGVTLTAMEPGAAGNITLEADGEKTLAELVEEHNTANPSNEILASGDETQVPEAGEITLSGGLDEVADSQEDYVVSEPTGIDSVADQIRAKWDSIQSNSAEATAYSQRAQAAAIKAKVVAINAFSVDLLNQFAAENIALGITADNKTEDVLDTMLPVMSALQGGAPTIAIKRAKAISPSEYDSKYVTAARLKSYVNKIEAFLGLPLSTSL